MKARSGYDVQVERGKEAAVNLKAQGRAPETNETIARLVR